jgi:hypothetical protein
LHFGRGVGKKMLNCKLGRTLFKYLGFLIAGNQRRLSFWNLVANRIHGKLFGKKVASYS